MAATFVCLAWFSSSSPQAAENIEALMARGFEERKDARTHEDYEKALRTLREAHAKAPSAHTVGQIGLTEQSLGRWVDAEKHIEEALRQADHPWVAKNRLHLENALVEVGKHVGALMIKGGVPGAAVYVRAAKLAMLPWAAPVRLGEGTIDVQIISPGVAPLVARSVRITPGEMTTVDASGLTATVQRKPGNGDLVAPRESPATGDESATPGAATNLVGGPDAASGSTSGRLGAWSAFGLGVGAAAVGGWLVGRDRCISEGAMGYPCEERGRWRSVSGHLLFWPGLAAAVVSAGVLLWSEPEPRSMNLTLDLNGLSLRGAW